MNLLSEIITFSKQTKDEKKGYCHPGKDPVWAQARCAEGMLSEHSDILGPVRTRVGLTLQFLVQQDKEVGQIAIRRSWAVPIPTVRMS